jgi:serine/threonine-protein kinase
MDGDRDLRVVLLALREGLIDPARLAQAGAAWVRAAHPSFLTFLTERGWITPEQCRRLAGGEPGQSPGAVTDEGGARHPTPPPVGETAEISVQPTRGPNETAAYPQSPAGGAPGSGGPGSSPGGRYRHIRLHRSGGLGHVWLAHDTVIGRDVALKELRSDRVGHAQLRARFLEEARITGQLEHPGIVPLYDLIPDEAGGDGPAHPRYTMRFVSGRTLAEAAEDYHRRRTKGQATPLDLAALLDAFVAVCHAVAYAHARNVLHRDLKGQNVVLGDFGEVFVLDWGLAKVLGAPEDDGGPAVHAGPEDSRETTQPGAMLGTPAFMAPELAAGGPASPASDIYALGVILYAILTGQLPYGGDDAADTLRKVADADPARPRSVNPAAPPALEAVCLKALARDPAARYASAEELAAEVRRWKADEPVAAYADPWAGRLARQARRHRTAAIAAVVFLLSAVAALTVSTALVWHEQRRTAEQKRHAEREWARAEENLGLARGLALNLLEIAETRLPAVRQTEPIRQEMTDAALRTFQQFLQQRPDDPELRGKTAALYRYSAKVHNNLNEVAAAERSYGESVHILDALVAQAPGEPLYRDQLAETLRDQSQVLDKLGRYGDAAAALRRAVGLADGLRAGAPDRPRYRRTLATARLALAGVEYARGQFAEAAESGREAAELFRGLLGAPAGESNPQDPLLLAVALNRRAMAERERGRPDDALAAHAAALAQLKLLLGRGGGNDVQHFHARALLDQGRTLALLPDRRPQVEGDFGQAILIWADLRKRYPAYPQYREWQAAAYEARGRLRADLDQPGPAGDDLDTSRALLEQLVKESPDLPGYRSHLGRTYDALGRLALRRGDPRRAVDWLTQAGEALTAAVARAPESALDRRALEDVRAELQRARGGVPPGEGKPGGRDGP